MPGVKKTSPANRRPGEKGHVSTPKPVKAQSTKKDRVSVAGIVYHTEDEWQKLLDNIAMNASVTMACEAAMISRTAFYDRKRDDPEFASRFEEAWERGYERMEEICRKRAYDGYEVPVYYKGEQVDCMTQYSDTLAMFLLKANRPKKFVDRSEVTTRGTNVNLGFDASKMTDEELRDMLTEKKGILEGAVLPAPRLVKKETK